MATWPPPDKPAALTDERHGADCCSLVADACPCTANRVSLRYCTNTPNIRSTWFSRRDLRRRRWFRRVSRPVAGRLERGGFRGQLRVDDLGEDLPDVEQEIEVLGLLPRGAAVAISCRMPAPG